MTNNPLIPGFFGMHSSFNTWRAEICFFLFFLDDASSDGSYEVEPEGNHSRQCVSLDANPRSPLTGTATNTSRPSSAMASHHLSRFFHIPIRPTRFCHSSRSSPHSRPPLPPNNHSSFPKSLSNPTSSSNRRSPRILINNLVDSIMKNLYELISVATDVFDMTVAYLTSQLKGVDATVQMVQTIDKNGRTTRIGMVAIGTCKCSLRSQPQLSNGSKAKKQFGALITTMMSETRLHSS